MKLIEDDLAVAVIDALTSHICVIDPTGTIIAVNRAWSEFTETSSPDRALDFVGTNYKDICRSSAGPGSTEAEPFLRGLTAVLKGEQAFFQMEYPCHSPTTMQWYLARVTPLLRRSSSIRKRNFGAVISHVNITDQKQIELKYAKLAATDHLTGVPNRRFFHDFATIDLERSRQFGTPSSVLIIDLDNFKSINDKYGHSIGDQVLRSVAAVSKATLRSGDLFARLGGEEFVCVLPKVNEFGAVLAAEKLRTAVERSNISGVSVTVSIGVTPVTETDETVEDALRRADKALYQAKRDGRNCVRSMSPTT